MTSCAPEMIPGVAGPPLGRLLLRGEHTAGSEIVGAPPDEVERPEEDAGRTLVDRQNLGLRPGPLSDETPVTFFHGDGALDDEQMELPRFGGR